MGTHNSTPFRIKRQATICTTRGKFIVSKIAVYLFVGIFVGACGGGGGDSSPGSGSNPSTGGGGGSNNNNAIDDVLDDLQVDTTLTPRISAQGNELPDDWSPLGTHTSVGVLAEIAVIGAPVIDTDVTTSESPLVVTKLQAASNNRYTWEAPLVEQPVAELAWADAKERLASTMADVDGDGIEEIVIVWQNESDVLLAIQRSGEDNYALDSAYSIDSGTWTDLELASGDFDGDGSIDLALGSINSVGSAFIKLLTNDGQFFSFTGVQLEFDGSVQDIGQLQLAPGDVDDDNATELAIAIMRSDSSGSRFSEYALYDDARTDFTRLLNGTLSAATASGTENAAVTSVALGDVDGDGRDEIVVAGLNGAGTVRNYSSFRHIAQVFDDAEQGYAEMANYSGPVILSGENLQPSSSGSTHRLNHVALVLADVDADGASEILITQRLFQSLRTSSGTLTPFNFRVDGGDFQEAVIPTESWFTRVGSSGQIFDFSHLSVSYAAGDVTGDRRDDIVIYSQRTGGSLSQRVEVWSLDQLAGWTMVQSYETRSRSSSSSAFNAQVLLPDIELDEGTAHLEYSEGNYRLVFTEPLIIAAIAAPPCARDLGQDLDECRSAFGRAISSSTSQTTGTTISARASIGRGVEIEAGLEIPGVGGAGSTASAEVTASLERAVRSFSGNTDTITRSLTYTTGPIEDSVVLTTLPIDVYTYTILSHTDPRLVGTTLDVRLPRDMVTLLVSLDFYESVRLPDAPAIAGTVFSHVEGDPSSYPSFAERGAIENRYDTLTGELATVGQGNGFTTSTVAEFSSTTNGRDAQWTASLDVRGTVGGKVSGNGSSAEAYAIAELGVGYGQDNAIEFTRGTETVVEGSVSNINTASFEAGEQYDWGLLNYLYDDGPGQPFEVINYWVSQ